jgi:hypothetical protein
MAFLDIQSLIEFKVYHTEIIGIKGTTFRIISFDGWITMESQVIGLPSMKMILLV